MKSKLMAFLKENDMNFEKIKNFINSFKGRTPATQTMLQYLLFVFISFAFWSFVSLNDNIQYDIEIPIKINNIPDSSTIITDIPQQVNVSVMDKGVSLLKFIVGQGPEINIKFNDYIIEDGMFYVSNADLRRYVRSVFESSTNINNMSLEDISLKYTNLPGKKVPIVMDVDVRPNIQCTIFGKYELDHDSAVIYSDENTLKLISEVRTSRIENKDLKDSLFTVVNILPIQGVKIEPTLVELMIPVEPLISKKVAIPVVVKNVPSKMNVITFPSKVEASFLVPFSMYHKNVLFDAVVDYKDVVSAKTNKVGVIMENAPEYYQNISLEQDSVEFIIERF